MEVGAAAVGFVALALQVAGGIEKLKKYYDTYKDASKDIQYIITQLEIQKHMIESIITEDTSLGSTGHGSSPECIRFCEARILDLGSIVQDLQRDTKSSSRFRRHIGAFRTILRQETIIKYTTRLQHSSTLLILYWQQNHSLHLRRIRALLESNSRFVSHAELETDQIAETTSSANLSLTPVTSVEHNEASLIAVAGTNHQEGCQENPGHLLKDQTASGYEDHQLATRRQKVPSAVKALETKIRLRILEQLLGQIYEISYQWSASGSRFHFEAFNVISPRSKIFRLAKNGKLKAIQRMFKNGQASVFDQDPNGSTPLHWAADNLQLETCRYLIAEGARVDAGRRSTDTRTPVHAAIQAAVFSSKESFDSQSSVLRLLLKESKTDIIEEEEDLNEIYGEFRGSKTLFLFLQHQSRHVYTDRPIGERLYIAASLLATEYEHNRADLVKLALGCEITAETVGNYITTSGRTYLHVAAGAVGSMYYSERIACYEDEVLDGGFELSDRDPSNQQNGLRKLLREIIAAVVDPHLKDQYDDTALRYMVFSFVYKMKLLKHYNKLVGGLRAVTRIFLEDLKSCGVDLQLYGTRESEILTDLKRDGYIWDVWILFRDLVSEDPRIQDPFSERRIDVDEWAITIYGFAFGPEPEDWHFYLSEPTDELAGDFWNWVEEDDDWLPDEMPPGTWVEE